MGEKCDVCRNLDSFDAVYGTQWTTGRAFEHSYLKFVDILASGQNGCCYCSLLASVVYEYVPDWTLRVDGLSIHVIAPDERPMEVRVSESADPHAEIVELAYVFLFLSIGQPIPSNHDNVQKSDKMSTDKHSKGTHVPELPRLGTCRTVAQSSLSPNVSLFIQDQLRNCSAHRSCDQRARTVLPKRVLAVGHDNEDICLHETSNEHGVYAALSYCWGRSTALLKTTQSTLATFKYKIEWQTVPRTIQDAIVIARRIGLKYIWVDCLCIVQDSLADWEIEAAKMCEYYQNAWVTIAATASRSAHDGIFNDRVGVTPPKGIIFTGLNGIQHGVISQGRGRKLWPATIHDLGPLAERAWTYQEHALSPRMLHFLDSEVIWECRTQTVSEDGHPIRNNSRGLIYETYESMADDPESFWALSVRAYSQRAITFLSDRLPAIAGIASLLHQHTGFRYVAGLWRETLERNLVWSSWGWEEIDHPPPIAPGPSWSWVSIHGGVAFAIDGISKDTSVEVHCVINDVTCQVSGKNPFGQVTSGVIDVTGPLLEMNLLFDGDLGDFGLPSYKLACDDITTVVFFPDTSLQNIEVMDGNRPAIRTVQRTAMASTPFRAKAWCLWCLTVDQEPSEMRVWLNDLPLALHGIVLAKMSASASTYTRVGSVSTNDKSLLVMSSRERLEIM
jgi:Heterokaryon incompatibility protein (HET)